MLRCLERAHGSARTHPFDHTTRLGQNGQCIGPLVLGANRISAIVLDEDLYPESFISEEIRLSIAEMRRREASDEIDVRISPFLDRYGDSRPLFPVITHPCRPALAYMANAILTHLGYAAAVPFSGRECLPYPHVPLPKCVSRFLRTRGGNRSEWDIADGERYHLPTATLTPVEYCARVVDYLRSKPPEQLLAELQKPHVRPFLQRLAHRVPGIPGIERWRAA
jgi:Polysaccharide biosynthesis enzyme WcbI